MHTTPIRSRLASLALLLALAPAGIGQTTFTSPPGFTNKEGGTAFHSTLGWHPDMRVALIDQNQRGTAMTLKGIAFRLDNRFYTPRNGTGRAFANVTIDMVHCDYDNFVRTFANNWSGTPTRVFSQAVSWPTVSGLPGQNPAPFGYRFPFAAWAYNGTEDICFDFRFTGGTLSNGPWVGGADYTFDGARSDPPNFNANTSNSKQLGLSGPGAGCADTGLAGQNGARITTVSTTFGPDFGLPAFRRNMVFSQEGTNFGPNATVITALGFRTIPGGTAFPGIQCNRLHLDTTLPYLLFQHMATSIGTLPKFHFGTPATGVPHVPSLVGATLATQSMWEDSGTSALRLSNATQNTIQAMPPGYIIARHKQAYAIPSTNPLAAIVRNIGTIWELTR